jgi:hypothetical protein
MTERFTPRPAGRRQAAFQAPAYQASARAALSRSPMVAWVCGGSVVGLAGLA